MGMFVGDNGGNDGFTNHSLGSEFEGPNMSECIYRTHDGYCSLHSDGVDALEYCLEGPCCDEKTED